MGSLPAAATDAERNDWIRDSKSVLLTSRRAAAAAATIGSSCSCKSRNSWSVLASAGICLDGSEGLGFIGMGTPRSVRIRLNLAGLAIDSRTSSSAGMSRSKRASTSCSAENSIPASSASTTRLRSCSSMSSARSNPGSTVNFGSTSIRMVWSICTISFAEVSLPSRWNNL